MNLKTPSTCVACAAEASNQSAAANVLALVTVLHSEATLESTYQDLCAAHRSVVDEAIAACASPTERPSVS